MSSWLGEGADQHRHDAIAIAAIVVAFVAAGSIAGYVIASGKPVPILLTLGAFAGLALLNALHFVVWCILVGVLLVSGPVLMHIPALEKLGWAFSILGFFLIGAALLYPAVGRLRFEGRVPLFVAVAIVFFTYGLVSIAYSHEGIGDGIRAGKRYFQFFGLIFILAVTAFPARVVRRWWAFLLALALLQLPFALYQRIKLVPLREGMGGGVFPLDIVVGTMEGSITGGGSSGVMVLLLAFALASQLALYRERILPLRWFVPLALITAAPLPLGEVNLFVILLPLAIAAIFFDMIRRRPMQFVFVALAIAVLTVFVGWAFLALNPEPGQSFGDRVASVIAYNFGETGYYGRGLNRTTVYLYWLQQQHVADPVSLVFGNGLGSSFPGLGPSNPGYMEQLHSGIFIGLTTASSVLWDLGVLGLFLYLLIFASAVVYAARLTRLARGGTDRALCRALLAMATMLCVMPFYSDSMIAVATLQVLTAFTIGLIAWRWRSEGRSNLQA